MTRSLVDPFNDDAETPPSSRQVNLGDILAKALSADGDDSGRDGSEATVGK